MLYNVLQPVFYDSTAKVRLLPLFITVIIDCIKVKIVYYNTKLYSKPPICIFSGYSTVYEKGILIVSPDLALCKESNDQEKYSNTQG